MQAKQAWNLLKKAVSSWSDDRASSMGAALSYYTMFSIAPLLLIVITVAGLVFGPEVVQGAVFEQLAGLLGEPGAEAVKEMLAHVSEPKDGAIATVVSIGALILGATTVFSELQNDLDRIWHVPEKEKGSGIWEFVRTKFLSLGLVLTIAFLITVSLLTTTALSALGKWWAPLFEGWEVVAHVLDLVVNFALLTAVFAMIYRYMPHTHIRWRDVWTGGAVTAVLFTIGKFLIGLYLGKSDVGSSFGTFGSLVIVMVWVYYSSQIFLLGAEFTWVYANEYGSRRGQTGAGTAAPAKRVAADRPPAHKLPGSGRPVDEPITAPWSRTAPAFSAGEPQFSFQAEPGARASSASPALEPAEVPPSMLTRPAIPAHAGGDHSSHRHSKGTSYAAIGLAFGLVLLALLRKPKPGHKAWFA